MPLLSPPLASGRVGGVRFDVLGEGAPVTVLAHGLGGTAAETRPLAARMRGTRVLVTFRGHGDSDALDGGWCYDALAEDLLAVADATGADRAVGLSLGGGALLRLLSREPDRFRRLGLVMPAALDGTRPDGATLRIRRLGEAIDRADAAAVTDLLVQEVPADARGRRGVRTLLARRAAQLVERPAPRPAYEDRPVADRRVLRSVTAPVLVLAQAGDPLHSVDVARELASTLPHSELVVLPEGGVFWTAARDAQRVLADALTPEEEDL